MKRRWKEGHEIAAAVLCPFVQSEGENHANQKTVQKQWNIPYQNDLENQSVLPCHKRLQSAPRQGTLGSKTRRRMRSFAQHSQKELSRPTAHPQGRRRKGKNLLYLSKTFRALRTAGADVKRIWRILGRGWQHGFTHASAGWPANSRYTAHARSAAGILPVLRLPRTLGAAAYAAPAAMIAKPINNRDRCQRLPVSLLLRA